MLIKPFRDPNFKTVEYYPFKSFKVKFPVFKLSSILDYSSGETASFTTLNNFETSPIPNILFINDYASNYSKSLKCSPDPMKIMGLSVAATADSAYNIFKNMKIPLLL
tara:strand:+ start:505 stop:828 length:324 start_codon:yes stop_codon:yes gene_type:complete